ncbi:hypothetical protein L596_002325 [Steinernema carpocapsae]|uniref:Uncharacterized protein n=1 Tax=Steinernema carpocapsae TaxID=34508 RepID=A0A4U8USV4_STECR|nr:hypothetical protein L596_002325 [Steinernema carpocapsae]
MAAFVYFIFRSLYKPLEIDFDRWSLLSPRGSGHHVFFFAARSAPITTFCRKGHFHLTCKRRSDRGADVAFIACSSRSVFCTNVCCLSRSFIKNPLIIFLSSQFVAALSFVSD